MSITGNVATGGGFFVAISSVGKAKTVQAKNKQLPNPAKESSLSKQASKQKTA